MFNNKPNAEDTGLDEELNHLLANMSDTDPFEENYATMADQFVKLYALKDTRRPQRVKPDTWALIAGNLLVTTIIVGYEQKAVVASKAKDFWLKLS